MLNPFGPVRQRLDSTKAAQPNVFLDPARSRPRYFDGRFLAARDLTREQNYFLSRQAALARSVGSGVVEGLFVEPGDTASSIRVGAGHGLTDTGELVVLSADVSVELADVVDTQRLNAVFNLRRLPHPPIRSRTGLFVLALRAVEFTANPISSYPTNLTEDRGLQDGDTIEASALTLIPISEQVIRDDEDLRRASLAKQIFLEGAPPRVPAGALPLAVVALQRGFLLWTDPFLVRRELGLGDTDVAILADRPRGAAEAQLQQYDQHLQDVLFHRRRANRGDAFAGSEHFLALPPAGRFPTASINPLDFTQIYFPGGMEVELSLAPEDEIPRLVNESLSLPPIDLTATDGKIETTYLVAIVPVERSHFFSMVDRVKSRPLVLKPPVPGFVAARSPVVMLRHLRLPRLPIPFETTDDTVAAAWRDALAGNELLWYFRRRNLTRKTEITGELVALDSGQARIDDDLTETLTSFGLNSMFTRELERAGPQGRSDVIALVSSSRDSRLRLEGVLHELESQERLGLPEVREIARKFQPAEVEAGLTTVENLRPDLLEDTTVVRNLARSSTMSQLGAVVARQPAEERDGFLKEVERLASRSGDDARVKLSEFVRSKLVR